MQIAYMTDGVKRKTRRSLYIHQKQSRSVKRDVYVNVNMYLVCVEKI